MAETLAVDTNLSPDGRVMEVLMQVERNGPGRLFDHHDGFAGRAPSSRRVRGTYPSPPLPHRLIWISDEARRTRQRLRDG